MDIFLLNKKQKTTLFLILIRAILLGLWQKAGISTGTIPFFINGKMCSRNFIKNRVETFFSIVTKRIFSGHESKYDIDESEPDINESESDIDKGPGKNQN